MILRIFLLISIILFIPGCAEKGISQVNITQINNKNDMRLMPLIGFRELKWGQNPALETEYLLKNHDKYGKSYYKKNENLTLGKVVVNSMEYRAYDDKLFMITAAFSKEKKLISLSKYLTTKFGTPSILINSLQSREISWDFYSKDLLDGDPSTKLSLKFTNSTESGELSIISNQFQPPISIYFN